MTEKKPFAVDASQLKDDFEITQDGWNLIATWGKDKLTINFDLSVKEIEDFFDNAQSMNEDSKPSDALLSLLPAATREKASELSFRNAKALSEAFSQCVIFAAGLGEEGDDTTEPSEK